MNFVLNEHHHTLHFSYNETSQLHTLSSSVKHKSIRKRQVGTGDVEYASDGGVNVDYQWINRDIAEENEIGNMQDVEYKLEEHYWSLELTMRNTLSLVSSVLIFKKKAMEIKVLLEPISSVTEPILTSQGWQTQLSVDVRLKP